MKSTALFLAGLIRFVCPAAASDAGKSPAEAALTMPDGFAVRAELALTPDEQSKGLMFRTELKENRGMLFVFSEPGMKTFWMKNTFVELDIVFLDKNMTVGKVFHRVTPSRPGQDELEVARVSSPASYVLELNGGAARRHGLKPGSRVKTIFPPAIKKQPAVIRRAVSPDVTPAGTK